MIMWIQLKKRSITLGLILLGFHGLAMGGTAQRSLAVGTKVESSCNISHVGSLNFGRFNPLDTVSLDRAPTIGIRCTAGSAGVRLMIGPGQNPWNEFSCAYPRRHLKGPNGVLLRYYLFTTYVAGQNLNYWGCAPGYPPQPGDSMTQTLPAFTLAKTSQTITVHARIYAGQSVPAGSYQDSLNISVVF